MVLIGIRFASDSVMEVAKIMAIGKKLRLAAILTVVASTSPLIGACSSPSTDSPASGDGRGKPINIALMMVSAGNGFSQERLAGAESLAKELGNVTITPFDGQFNADEQFAQIQNIAQTGKYDAIYVEPFDGVSLAGAFPLVSDIPVVTINAPIGSDYSNMQKPQVEQVLQTIGDPPGDLAEQQAGYVVDYCAKIDPCKVVAMVGFLSSALDVTRMKTYKEVLSKHPNIKVVAESEGNWDRDKALAAMSNILQANRDINVFLTAGDQMAFGATVALQNAGVDPEKIFISSVGGTRDAIKNVRQGLWDMTAVYLTYTAGRIGVQSIVDHLSGKQVPEWISYSKLDPNVPMWVTREELAKMPDFTGEWNG
jgi:ribose transport system substrate-binding protein